MGYPANPSATGDLVVGNLTLRTWVRLNPGAEGQVLKINTFDTNYLMEWTDDLGVKSLKSDLTLLDNVGGSENLVVRVNATGETSFVNSNSSQQMYFGGHGAASALGLNLV